MVRLKHGKDVQPPMSDVLERLASDEAFEVVQRILKNSKEASEKMAKIKAEIDKAAEEFKKI